MGAQKKKVLMYYAFDNKVGGPLVYLRSIVNSELKEEFEFATCFQNASPGGLSIKLLLRMIKQIKSQSPDIVHVHGLQSEGFYGVFAAKIAGCKCIVTTVHGFAFDGQKTHWIKRWIYRHLVEPFTLRLSDKVYCVCRFASERNIIKANTHNNNCGYIHNAVADMVPKRTRDQVRTQLGIEPDEFVFVIAGRMCREKGIDILEKAVKCLNSFSKHKFKLLLVGDGEYLNEFCTNMAIEMQNGQVIVAGRSDCVADFLAASDVFVLPSYHENLPIALLEAGKMGLPCIASNVGGIPEIIEDGRTGFLISDAQPYSYAQRMELLMSDDALRLAMGRSFCRDINSRFSMSIMCKKIRKVYIDGMREKGIE